MYDPRNHCCRSSQSLTREWLGTTAYASTTYYWLASYFLVFVGMLRIIRREPTGERFTVAAAWLSMAAIVHVAIEMFLSPVDAGTSHLRT